MFSFTFLAADNNPAEALFWLHTKIITAMSMKSLHNFLAHYWQIIPFPAHSARFSVYVCTTCTSCTYYFRR